MTIEAQQGLPTMIAPRTAPESAASESLSCDIPGIVLFSGDRARTLRSDQELEVCLAKGFDGQTKPAASVRLGDWFVACLVGRPGSHQCHDLGSTNGISVLLDGYVSDLATGDTKGIPASEGAALIARLYRIHGKRMFHELRGSFVGCVIDHQAGTALLFNDQTGSRPLFLRVLGDGVCIAPQVRFLAKLDAGASGLNERAVGEFLLRGCYYGADTLFRGIDKIAQATCITLSQLGRVEEKYWSLRLSPVPGHTDEDLLIDELDVRLRRGMRRVLNVTKNPVLLLSGGVDSRIMLACLLAEGAEGIAAMSYAVSNTDGDDHLVADLVAKRYGLAHESYIVDIKDFPAAAPKEVMAADGRVQMIDAPSNRWEHIAARFDGMLIGDECFGWKGHARSVGEALDLVGWWNLDKSYRIADWLKADVLKRIRAAIDDLRNELVLNANAKDHDDLKDELYYTERMGNLLNGYSARRLGLTEQLRPLLDEDVIAFMCKVPRELRRNKMVAVRLMEKKYPALNALPYAKKTSVPWRPPQFAAILRENRALAEFIVDALTRRLDPRLQDLLDQERLHATLTALITGRGLPPLRTDWWARIPGLWRFGRQRSDGVSAMQGALRLVNLNLYLTNC